VSFPQHVVFDLDGTLVDSVPGIAWSVDAALRSCGLPPAGRDLTPLIGPPVRDILAAVSGVSEPDLLDRLERGFRCSYDSAGWRLTVCQPGVREMLSQLLSAGVGLWLVTNKPALSTAMILCELRLDGFFREIVSRDSRTPVFASKSEMLTDLLERHGIARAACLLAGDTMEDWHAAEAAAVPCVIVPHGYGGASLPPGCRRIGGWRELLQMCANTGAPAPAAHREVSA
jgi:phosphoglycolate phosphatase